MEHTTKLTNTSHILKEAIGDHPEYKSPPCPAEKACHDPNVKHNEHELLDRYQSELQGRHEPDYVLACLHFIELIAPLLLAQPQYQRFVVPFLTPEDTGTYRLQWRDASGAGRLNTVYHVQFSSARGPPFGMLCWDETVSLGGVKTMAKRQAVVNSFTKAMLGASCTVVDIDFASLNPVDREAFANAFCSSFLTRVPQWHLMFPGPSVTRTEMGLLAAHARRIAPQSAINMLLQGADRTPHSALAEQAFGGVGAAMAIIEIAARHDIPVDGKRVLIFGGPELAMSAAMSLAERGARPVSVPVAAGYLMNVEGFTRDDLVETATLEDITASPYLHLTRAGVLDLPADIVLLLGPDSVSTPQLRALLDANTVIVAEVAPVLHVEHRRVMRDRGVLHLPPQLCTLGHIATISMTVEQDQEVVALPAEAIQARIGAVLTEAVDSVEEVMAEYALRESDYDGGSAIWAFAKTATAMFQQGE